MLAGATFAPHWPTGISLKTLADANADQVARDAHGLIAEAFGDMPQDFEAWWQWLGGDDDYDPALVFVAYDGPGRPMGVAQCWASGYLKDLAVAPAARGQGHR